MYYMVYETKNLLNGKIYVGQHSTTNLDDEYLGSGTYLKKAIAKYGRQNFRRTILFVFDDQKSMSDKEREIVDTDFCLRTDTYNITEGGNGGFGFINRTGINNQNKDLSAIAEKVAKKTRGKKRVAVSAALKEQHAKGIRPSPPKRDAGWFHTEQSKHKMSAQAKGKRVGDRNGSFGSRWMHHCDLGPQRVQFSEIDKFLSQGYEFGRKPEADRLWRNADGSLRTK